jgi:YHS domain-containing protein
MPREINPVETYIDPVCLMRVDPQGHHPTFTYRMRTYHFCADTCRRTFEKNPNSYLSGKPPRKKNLWQRYLDRLNKATGGKPPSCCQ